MCVCFSLSRSLSLSPACLVLLAAEQHAPIPTGVSATHSSVVVSLHIAGKLANEKKKKSVGGAFVAFLTFVLL